MNTRRVNAAAAEILAAQRNGFVTPSGWAAELEKKHMLQDPEMAAEMERLRQQVAELESQVAALTAQNETLKARVADLTVAVESPELCADCGHHEDAHSSGGDVECTASGARLLRCSCSFFIPRYGAADLVVAPPDQVERSADRLTRLLAPTQALRLEDPHDSPLHHAYRLGRDLPEAGAQ